MTALEIGLVAAGAVMLNGAIDLYLKSEQGVRAADRTRRARLRRREKIEAACYRLGNWVKRRRAAYRQRV